MTTTNKHITTTTTPLLLPLLLLVLALLLQASSAFLPSPPPHSRTPPLLLSSSSSSDNTNTNDDTQTAHKRVELRVYDIGGKYTPMMSALLRKEMPAIWHVGVGVYGREYWFSTKIESKDLGDTETAFGMAPMHTYDLGMTSVEMDAFEEFLEEELNDRFNMDTYKVFTHNCNHFARDALEFLTGGEVEMPGYILENSDKALEALPKGQALLTKSIANQVARVVMLAWGTANRSKEEIARREARRKKKEGGGEGGGAATA